MAIASAGCFILSLAKHQIPPDKKTCNMKHHAANLLAAILLVSTGVELPGNEAAHLRTAGAFHPVKVCFYIT